MRISDIFVLQDLRKANGTCNGDHDDDDDDARKNGGREYSIKPTPVFIRLVVLPSKLGCAFSLTDT